MPEQTRNTKKLAQRIDRGYLKRDFWLPRWKRLLSIAVTALGVAWLGWQSLSGKQEPFNAGPLSHGHTILTGQCSTCHVSTAASSAKVTDASCTTCHGSARHQAKQTFTPACTSCHIEHQGAFGLAKTSNQSCAQCHASLKATDAKLKVDPTIASLADGHPEFAAIAPKHAPDPGTLRFGHAIHMKPALKGPNGAVQLECTGCHAISGAAKQLTPVKFVTHCANCHPLNFDRRFNQPAPHKDTRTVLDYVTAQYTAYIALHPAEIRQPIELNSSLPQRPLPPLARNANEWAAQRSAEAERLLWQKSCKECHVLTYPAPDIRPEVAKAAIPTTWMPRARFDHTPHQLVTCTTCHAQATTRNETADVMLPPLASCQRCHNDSANAVGATCSECHIYHDPAKIQTKQGPFVVSRLP
jgi:hypothetical protein